MNVLRLTLAATAAAVMAAAGLASSCSGPAQSDCGLPDLTERGADGGPDPCHCAPPPALNISTCPCGSGNQEDIGLFNACMFLYLGEMDAGLGG